MGDRLANGHLGWKDGQTGTDVCHHGLAVPNGPLQVHINLGRMHAFGMFIQLGPPRPAPHLGDLGNLSDQRLGQRPHAIGFRQRSAWVEHHAQHQRTLIEGRQKGAWKKRDACSCCSYRQCSDSHQHLGARKRPAEHLRIPPLEPGYQRAVTVVQPFHPRQQVKAQHGRYCHRDQHRGQH